MPAPEPQSEERWIPVARLLRPQGRRGELLSEPLTDLPEVFSENRRFRIASPSQSVLSGSDITLQEYWRPHGRNAGRLVLKLAGVDSISAAEMLEGKELLLPEADLPALDADTFLVRDLVGCELFDNDRSLGTVIELEFPIGADGHTRLVDAADLLVVRPHDAGPESEPVLVPFVKAWLLSVDLQARSIIMNLPSGLFDTALEAEP